MHSSTLIPQLAPSSDHDTTNGFSLLTSLRQHFTALRQQDADVHASQAHGNPDHSWTPYWVGPCDLRQNSQTDALGSYTFKLPDSQRMIIQPAKHTKKSRKSLVFLNHNKVRHHKQRQHHKQHQRQEKHQDNVLHNLHSASHQLAGGPQNGQHHQLEAAYCSAQQEKVSLRAAATPASAQALQLHQVQNACKAHIGHSSSVLTRNQHTPLPEVHNAKLASRKTAVPETYTTQATADGSHVGCIRALPRVVWQDVLKTTDSIPATHDLCLKHFRGRPNANPFQIACDLSKAGQRRTQNLHAAVRASLQLMHRFVVRRSAIAHMGVFTTGNCFPCSETLLPCSNRSFTTIYASPCQIRMHNPGDAAARQMFAALTCFTDVMYRISGCWRVGDGVCW